MKPSTVSLLPQPQSLSFGKGSFRIPSAGVIGIAGSALYPASVELQALFPGFAVNASFPGSRDTVGVALRQDLRREGYRLSVSRDGIRIEAASAAGVFYAVQTLRQLVAQTTDGRLRSVEIDDWPDFEDRGVYYDVARGRVPKLERLLQMADQLGKHKINQLQLYIEHTFLFRGHPDIGKDASPLSAEDILKLDAHCRQRHIELVPSLASFGHLATVLKHPRYHALAEDWGVGKYVDPGAHVGWGTRGWTLSPANPDIYVFLDSLFAEFLPLFSSARFNACCDETYDLGWGQSYELCRQRGKGRVYLDHIVKVSDLARKYGKRMMFWGDIIRHYPELISEIPEDVIVLDWGYGYNHPFEKIRDFKQAGLDFLACPGTSSWVSLFPRLPEARANIAGFAAAGKKSCARGLLNTDWGDGGHYNFMEYSWHGYLFGAEQAWNTGADQRSFTRRFVERFLGAEDAELAAALDELGDIAFCNVNGCYQSVWQTILFALPGEAIFNRSQPVDGASIWDGKIVACRFNLDAALAASLLPRLRKIRSVFAARSGRRGIDPVGVLPYWVFAVDTIAMAVRRLAAYGPGSTHDKAARAVLKRGLRALRKRFQQLWLARNRTAEIGATLARYDRVIRGESVRTQLAEVGAGRVRVTVSNAGDMAVSGTVTLRASPAEAASVVGPGRLVFRKLRPRASKSMEFALNVVGSPGRIVVNAAGAGPGVGGASLVIYGERNWAIPAIAGASDPAAVAGLLAAAPVRPVLVSGALLAEVRAAVAGDDLAIAIKVADVAVRRGMPVWAGSCVEVFGSAATDPCPGIGKVFLAPPAGGEPAAAFKLDGAIVPAPEIRVAAASTGTDGYTLCALVPLSLLRIPAGSIKFRLEMIVTAWVADGAEHQRAPLFYAAENAWCDNAGFGAVTVEA